MSERALSLRLVAAELTDTSYKGRSVRYSCLNLLKNAKSAVRRAQKRYYAKHRAQYCAGMRQRYDLAGPKLFIQHHYITEVCKNVLGSKKVLSLLEKELSCYRIHFCTLL